VLHKVGLTRITVEPDGPDGWKFTGPAHMLPLAVHRRVKAAPPDTPQRLSALSDHHSSAGFACRAAA